MVVRCVAVCLLAGFCLVTGIEGQQVNDPNGSVFLGGTKEKKTKKPTSRTLRGTVSDHTGKPLAGALVTLTDVAKGEKITFITKKDGRYLFENLPFHVEYEVSAQYEDMRSDTKHLSQYDDLTPAIRPLEVAPAAKEAEKH